MSAPTLETEAQFIAWKQLICGKPMTEEWLIAELQTQFDVTPFEADQAATAVFNVVFLEQLAENLKEHARALREYQKARRESKGGGK